MNLPEGYSLPTKGDLIEMGGANWIVISTNKDGIVVQKFAGAPLFIDHLRAHELISNENPDRPPSSWVD